MGNIQNKYLQKIEEKCYLGYSGNKAKNEKGEEEFLDQEQNHKNADNIIVEFLKEIGYTKLADKYQKLTEDFWYA